MITDLYNIEDIVVSGAGNGLFVVELNPDSEIYKVHFPGQPITPGACILQIVDDMFHNIPEANGLHLAEVVNLKFLCPIDPRVSTRLEVKMTYSQETRQVKAEVKHNGATASKLSLRYECL